MMITDRRKFTTKITLYGMSRFHFYRWHQFKVILLERTLRTRNLPKFSATSDAGRGLMTSEYCQNGNKPKWRKSIENGDVPKRRRGRCGFSWSLLASVTPCSSRHKWSAVVVCGLLVKPDPSTMTLSPGTATMSNEHKLFTSCIRR